ncbi:MAG: extracellular solute-binding protein [Pseudomonadales bacterium]|nr:extracellular solute-binding protein [Pseudomonadales bacterium]NRA14720.1 extracellular solute-binding protein [Oceanospirillaceae bacterium]
MKKLLKRTIVATAIAAVSMTMATTAAQAEETFTIVSWGGAYTKSQQRAYHEPYTAKTGTKFLHEDKSGTALAGIRSQVEANNVTWDLVDILEGDAMIACDEGLVEEINYDEILAAAPDGTPASKDFLGGLNGCFIPQIYYATLFAFNDEIFTGEKPSTIADVFDLKKFPGKRALEKTPAGNLEWALMADGVAPNDIYDALSTEEGVARAFKKLDTIKDSVIWWEAGAQPPQLLSDKEVSIASGYNGRFFGAQVNEKQPFTIIWDGQLAEIDGWVVPKGKLTTAMKAYIKFATDTQRLADQSKYISYGPARKSSAAFVDKHADTGIDMKPHMPTSPTNFTNPVIKNAEWWANNKDDMSERFNAWLAK